jgi:phenylalanyl-tRNA synthetase beta chain
MRFSYNWLRELSKTKKSPKDLAEILNLRAFEVERVEPFDIARGKKDYLMDIKVSANRGHDALSHVGVAREIRAIERRSFPGDKLLSRSLSPYKFVSIKDKKLCPRYIGAVMANIKVRPSPKWMQEKLLACGLRPINNIVDATNYVMLETGQPMHAFDKNKLTTNNKQLTTILVRRAKKNEKINLLDGGEKILTSEDLVIADSQKALAVAGIKGGAEAEISEAAKVIVLEAANFNAAAIRKSRTRLGLKTDASDRFERELDPNLAEFAMARAIKIISGFGGKVEGVADVYPKKVKPWRIVLDLNYVNKLLGENIPAGVVKKILNSLGLETKPLSGSLLNKERGKKKGIIETIIPTFRIDLKTKEDLIEEIGRIYGYEKIKPQAPRVPVETPPVNENRQFERLVKNILAGKGFSEAYNYSFYSQRDAGLTELGAIKHLEVENPMNLDQALLRVSLIPGILKNVRENLKRYKDILIFEVGRVYWPSFVPLGGTSAGKPNKTALPEEKRMLTAAVVASGTQKREIRALGFYESKGYCDVLLEKLGVSGYYYDTFEAVPVDTLMTLWHEGRSAAIKIEGSSETIGYVGEINPLVLANFDIHERVAVFKFNLEKLQSVSEKEREFEPIRKYPGVTRDISMVSPGGVLVDGILQTIQKAGGNLVLDVDLFDIYDFPDGSSSYAFHIIFGADNRTLEGGEVDEAMKRIIGKLEDDLKVKVRR